MGPRIGLRALLATTMTTLILLLTRPSHGFVQQQRRGHHGRVALRQPHLETPRREAAVGGREGDGEDLDNLSFVSSSPAGQCSRRNYLAASVLATAAGLMIPPEPAAAAYTAAVRPTAYRVDSTIPPSLLPVTDKQKKAILSSLGRGFGTDKEAVFIDKINLNNMLNKAVFGSINAVSTLTNPKVKDSGPGYASFVCVGLPSQASTRDTDLAVQLLDPIVNVKQRASLSTAIGFAGFPYSSQAKLKGYQKGDVSLDELESVLSQAGVEAETWGLYKPLLEWAKQSDLDLLALAPERADAETARSKGLQFVEAERRSAYVVDPEGFIALPQDPRFKVYADRSLLKDFVPRNDKESPGSLFAERILVHEAGATAAAQYATSRPDSLVVLVAPMQDMRYLGGMNGRIPRIYRKLRPEDSKVTDKAVTTILLNPTARDTLSRTNYLRLEIGTSPEFLEYQTKVADYLWFSSSPKVNQLPRLMN
jgi:hypothetical protein